ncbi:hypothetical protein WDU94_006492 [Cyamophila willieti]
MSTNRPFFIVSNNRISFRLSLVFYCSFRVCVILISCDDDSCFAIMLIGVGILEIYVPQKIPDAMVQRGPKTIQ